jgi:hypothetical protein
MRAPGNFPAQTVFPIDIGLSLSGLAKGAARALIGGGNLS